MSSEGSSPVLVPLSKQLNIFFFYIYIYIHTQEL